MRCRSWVLCFPLLLGCSATEGDPTPDEEIAESADALTWSWTLGAADATNGVSTCSAPTMSCVPVASLLARREGFGRFATGGLNGKVVVVTSSADNPDGNPPAGGGVTLRDAVSKATGPTWVVFSKTVTSISLRSQIVVPSNITVDGRPQKIGQGPVVIRDAGFLLDGASNVILSHLVLNGRFCQADGRPQARFGPPQCVNPMEADGTVDQNPPDGLRVQSMSHDVWVDHLDMSNYADKLVAITGGGTDVTISWSRLHSSMFGVLVNTYDSTPRAGRMFDERDRDAQARVTIHHSLLASITQRNPRVAFGSAHLYNNVIFDWSLYAMSFGAGAKGLVEGNLFFNNGARQPDNILWSDFIVTRLTPALSRTYAASINSLSSWYPLPQDYIRGVFTQLTGNPNNGEPAQWCRAGATNFAELSWCGTFNSALVPGSKQLFINSDTTDFAATQVTGTPYAAADGYGYISLLDNDSVLDGVRTIGSSAIMGARDAALSVPTAPVFQPPYCYTRETGAETMRRASLGSGSLPASFGVNDTIFPTRDDAPLAAPVARLLPGAGNLDAQDVLPVGVGCPATNATLSAFGATLERPAQSTCPFDLSFKETSSNTSHQASIYFDRPNAPGRAGSVVPLKVAFRASTTCGRQLLFYLLDASEKAATSQAILFTPTAGKMTTTPWSTPDVTMSGLDIQSPSTGVYDVRAVINLPASATKLRLNVRTQAASADSFTGAPSCGADLTNVRVEADEMTSCPDTSASLSAYGAALTAPGGTAQTEAPFDMSFTETAAAGAHQVNVYLDRPKLPVASVDPNALVAMDVGFRLSANADRRLLFYLYDADHQINSSAIYQAFIFDPATKTVTSKWAQGKVTLEDMTITDAGAGASDLRFVVTMPAGVAKLRWSAAAMRKGPAGTDVSSYVGQTSARVQLSDIRIESRPVHPTIANRWRNYSPATTRFTAGNDGSLELQEIAGVTGTHAAYTYFSGYPHKSWSLDIVFVPTGNRYLSVYMANAAKQSDSFTVECPLGGAAVVRSSTTRTVSGTVTRNADGSYLCRIQGAPSLSLGNQVRLDLSVAKAGQLSYAGDGSSGLLLKSIQGAQ